MKACSSASRPMIASAISVFTFSTARSTTLAEEARLVAVTQLDRLARAGGGARRYRGAAHHAGFQQHVGFDGEWVAAGIENLAGDHINDCTHV